MVEKFKAAVGEFIWGDNETDYEVYDDYMSINNKNKCPHLVHILNRAYMDVDDDITSIGCNIIKGMAFKEITPHINKCSACKKHPLLK